MHSDVILIKLLNFINLTQELCAIKPHATNQPILTQEKGGWDEI